MVWFVLSIFFYLIVMYPGRDSYLLVNKKRMEKREKLLSFIFAFYFYLFVLFLAFSVKKFVASQKEWTWDERCAQAGQDLWRYYSVKIIIIIIIIIIIKKRFLLCLPSLLTHAHSQQHFSPRVSFNLICSYCVCVVCCVRACVRK